MQITVWTTVLEGDKVIVEIMRKDTTSEAVMDLALLLHHFYQEGLTVDKGTQSTYP